MKKTLISFFLSLVLFVWMFPSCAEGQEQEQEQEQEAGAGGQGQVAGGRRQLNGDSGQGAGVPVSAVRGLSAALPYDLSEPSDKFKMPDRLREISGLGMVSKKRVACVQDEKGNIYIYHTKKEEIQDKIDFAGDGDYEGIEFVGDTAWVLRYDGTLYEIAHPGTKDQEKTKHATFITKDYDTEGLGYDKANNRLLIACKGKAGDGDEWKGKRAIYGFDLDSRKYSDKPLYSIDLEILHKAVAAGMLDVNGKDDEEFFDPDKDKVNFAPSGVAVHPVDGNLYVISTVGKALIVLSQANAIEGIYKLKKKDFSQPEGIAFEPDGDMLISNEGRDGRADILKFKYLLKEKD